MSEMCSMRLAENTGCKFRQKFAVAHHRTTKACIDNGKNLLNSNISSTRSHNMVNFDPLTAEIGWRVWDTPANFNGFRVLASFLHQRR